MKESLRQCIRPLGGEFLLALMRYAAYLSFEITPASYGPFRQAGFRCAVLTVLSSSLIRCRPRWGELDVAGCYACLYCQCLGYCSIVLARREHCPRDPRQFVCCCHDQYVSWRPGLKRGHPGAHRDSVPLGSQYDRACSMNQDLAQVRVAALADSIQPRLATGRMLLRQQPHPGREPMEATIAVATSGPMPGICRSLRHAASLEAIRSTSSFICTI